MVTETKKAILIADDEPDLVEVLKYLLDSQGFHVEIAVDGEEALEKVHNGNFDLILLDVMMPKMNGYQVCRLLKFDERYKNVPIIMLTARGQEKDKKTGEEVGADLYIVKPYDPVELLAKLNGLLKP